MYDMIREIQEHRRVKDIKRITKDRKVDVLCHFTRVENLCGILREGLLGRRLLAQRGTPFFSIDDNRVDGYPEAVCLTISFPNYRMFYAKREEYLKKQNVSWNQWIVLLLEADLLWELTCAFCQQNAAHGSVSAIALEDRLRPLALEQVFFDFNGIRRVDLNIPRNCPTNPQAEVLVFDTIPVSYVREIHFYDMDACTNWFSRNNVVTSAEFRYGDHYFSARKDYEVWRREQLGSN